jgi:hypothetical protein
MLSGIQMKHFKSGAVMNGNVKNEKFNGYGVMTWNTGTYIGDWVNSKRHGMGIYRMVDGTEYVGSFKVTNALI